MIRDRNTAAPAPRDHVVPVRLTGLQYDLVVQAAHHHKVAVEDWCHQILWDAAADRHWERFHESKTSETTTFRR